MSLHRYLNLIAKSLFLLIITCNVSKAHESLKNDRLTSILKNYNYYVEQTFSQWKLPGIAIAIVDESGIRYIKTLGVKKVGSNDAINKNTVFRIASLSKAITSTLTLKTLKEKNISLDTPLYRLVADFKTADPQFKNIKIRNVLSHTTGLPHDLYASLVESNFSYKEIKNRLFKVLKIENTGKRYAYQNFVFSMAGEAVSNVTGKSFEQNLKEKIFSPLQMNDSSAGADGFLKNSNRALPHAFSNLKFIHSHRKLISTYYTVTPAGGVNSSISDMGKWLHAQFGNTKVISSSEISELTKPVIPYAEKMRNSFWKKKRYKGSYYALGWRKMNYAHKSIVFHGGVLHGFTNIIAYLPEEKVGIVILSNANTVVPGFLMARFFDTFLNLDLHDYNNIEYANIARAMVKPKIKNAVKKNKSNKVTQTKNKNIIKVDNVKKVKKNKKSKT